ADRGLSGAHDARHLQQAIQERRSLLSGNYKDFRFLHDLVLEAQGHHFGVLVVRKDNDPRKDMKPRDIVRAIGKLLAAAVPIGGQYVDLNHWRGIDTTSATSRGTPQVSFLPIWVALAADRSGASARRASARPIR